MSFIRTMTEAEATGRARSFFCKFLDGLGVQPDAAFGSLDENLRTALTVGRPIAEGATR